jgi:hypothetical protein
MNPNDPPPVYDNTPDLNVFARERGVTIEVARMLWQVTRDIQDAWMNSQNNA